MYVKFDKVKNDSIVIRLYYGAMMYYWLDFFLTNT